MKSLIRIYSPEEIEGIRKEIINDVIADVKIESGHVKTGDMAVEKKPIPEDYESDSTTDIEKTEPITDCLQWCVEDCTGQGYIYDKFDTIEVQKIPFSLLCNNDSEDDDQSIIGIYFIKNTFVVRRASFCNPKTCWTEYFAIGPEEEEIIGKVKEEVHKNFTKEDAVKSYNKVQARERFSLVNEGLMDPVELEPEIYDEWIEKVMNLSCKNIYEIVSEDELKVGNLSNHDAIFKIAEYKIRHGELDPTFLSAFERDVDKSNKL